MNMNEHAELPLQPTSSLQQFAVLVGEWKMVGTHPLSHLQCMGILPSNY
jgi:hypothetical protein